MHHIPLVGPGRYRRGHTPSCTAAVGSACPQWGWSPSHGCPIICELHHRSQWPPLGDGTGQHFKLVNLILRFNKYISKPEVYIEAYFKLFILPLQ